MRAPLPHRKKLVSLPSRRGRKRTVFCGPFCGCGPVSFLWVLQTRCRRPLHDAEPHVHLRARTPLKSARRTPRKLSKRRSRGYDLPWWQGFVGKNPLLKEQVEENKHSKHGDDKGSEKQQSFELPWWNVSVSTEGPSDEGREREEASEGSQGAKSEGVEFLAPAYEQAVGGKTGPHVEPPSTPRVAKESLGLWAEEG